MTKQEELKAYKRALKDYQSVNPVLDKWGKDFDLSIQGYGFCHYFDMVHRLMVYGESMNCELPTLYSLQPEKWGSFIYWFQQNVFL